MMITGKLQQIRDALKGAFVERETVIDGLLTALLAREHVLLLGPPGTAKSALALALCNAIDAARFYPYLFTRFTTPDEIFGPVSLAALERDSYERIVSGRAADVEVFFADEVFKANSAVLNSQLTLLNERVFDNGGKRVSCPLEVCIGASNEMPEGPELGALFDRFAFKFWVDYIHDRDKLRGLLTARAGNPTITEKINLGELHAAQVAAAALPVPDGVVDILLDLKANLESKGIVASDRSWRKTIQVVRARALLEGAPEASEDHVEALADVLWREPDQRATVATEVGKLANPLTAEAVKLLDLAREAMKNFPPQIDTDAALASAARLNREVRQMVERGQKLLNGKSSDRTRRLSEALVEIEAIRVDMAKRTAQASGLA